MMKLILKTAIGLALIAFGFSLRFLIPLFMGMPDMGMPGMGEMPPPGVRAVVVESAPVDVRDEYIASVEPVRQVIIRSEVAGYVDAVHFEEGSLVSEGDLLFTIDQKQYLAQVNARKAELASADAELERAEKFLSRLQTAGERSVSQSDIDTAESAHLQAVAVQQQAEANLRIAEINLEYSEIRAPISGRIGAAMITKGNYASSATSELARIVQVDPIRVVFSMTDRAYLNARSKALAGSTDVLAAQVRLPNGVMLPTIGKMEFTDNAMNMKTGTMAIRYLFDNPDEMLVAGGYVNILVGKSDRPMGLRVPQRAVLADADGAYLLSANEESVVEMVRVELGEQVERDVVILSGLNEGDSVIVDGVQKAMPGMAVNVMFSEDAP